MANDLTMKELLTMMVKTNASDLHLIAYAPPKFRINGKLKAGNISPLPPDKVKKLVYSVLNEKQRQILEEDKGIDFSFSFGKGTRFRGSIFFQTGTAAGVFRMIKNDIYSFEQLGLPSIVKQLTDKPKGLILVTGPTGSGKTTTLATMIDNINKHYEKHIITIEDPIEFRHSNKKCNVVQRELNLDTNSFADSLRQALRQDPDVLMVGEMRDFETMDLALKLAETGHLCLATLHTNSAVESINRIINTFPYSQHTQVRQQISFVLQAVLCQTLVPSTKGGRVLALEILTAIPSVRSMIRENKVQQLYGLMQTGGKFGMKTMNQALFDLIKSRTVKEEDALRASPDIEELKKMLGMP